MPAVILPSGNLLSLEHTVAQPLRKRGTVTLLSIDSFIRFVNEHKRASSRVFTKEGRFVAVLDFHPAGEKGSEWGEFRALFNSNFSEQWLLWNNFDGKFFQQRPFAEFIEENISDIIEPKPAEMLDISRTLEAKKDVVFKQATRLDNGDNSLRYEETTAAKAGANGDLEVPKTIALSIPVFFGMAPETVGLRLKFQIDNGRLTLKYEIIRKKEFLELAAQKLIARVNSECSTKCYDAEEPLPAQKIQLS